MGNAVLRGGAMRQTTVSTLDASAAGLSLMCLIHCLLLPVFAAFLPVAGVLAEMEWIHKALVLTALPITALAIARHRTGKVRFSFVLPAVLGLALLLAAGFVEELHEFETPLTVAGAVLLASAHIWRWMNRSAVR
jgi:hypothetical protein